MACSIPTKRTMTGNTINGTACIARITAAANIPLDAVLVVDFKDTGTTAYFPEVEIRKSTSGGTFGTTVSAVKLDNSAETPQEAVALATVQPSNDGTPFEQFPLRNDRSRASKKFVLRGGEVGFIFLTATVNTIPYEMNLYINT